MALEIWFRDDIDGVLTALAMARTGAHGDESETRGYLDALRDVGLAFRIPATVRLEANDGH